MIGDCDVAGDCDAADVLFPNCTRGVLDDVDISETVTCDVIRGCDVIKSCDVIDSCDVNGSCDPNGGSDVTSKAPGDETSTLLFSSLDRLDVR